MKVKKIQSRGATRMKITAFAMLTIALAGTNGAAIADPPNSAGTVAPVLKQPLPLAPGNEVVVVTVDYAPGDATPPHEHPGYTYAYVLEGSVVSQLAGEQPHTYTKGQMWTETPHQHHIVSKNASASEPAKLLVFFIAPHDEKLITMLPPQP